MFFLRNRISYKKWSDTDLVSAYRTAKPEEVLAEIYLRYGHLVMGCGLKYLKNRADAEDLTMHVFSVLPDKLLRHEIDYLKSWLYTLTKNECLQILRKKKYYNQELDEKLAEEELSDNIEPDLQLLEIAVSVLKNEQKLCIEEFYLNNLSYQEISDRHNIPLQKVKSAIQNGKRNLKIWMENNPRNEDEI